MITEAARPRAIAATPEYNSVRNTIRVAASLTRTAWRRQRTVRRLRSRACASACWLPAARACAPVSRTAAWAHLRAKAVLRPRPGNPTAPPSLAARIAIAPAIVSEDATASGVTAFDRRRAERLRSGIQANPRSPGACEWLVRDVAPVNPRFRRAGIRLNARSQP